MSEPILISPLLDGFLMGDPISDHNGIRCCPAMKHESGEKFIVKIISLPPSPTQLDAMLLAGVFPDQQAAVKYYEDRANDYIREIEVLQQLARQEGFLSCSGYQSVPSQEHIGFDVYILNNYMRSLERQFSKKPITHLEALNMSLDICAALAACRRSGYIFANLKPTNIFLTEKGEYKISDLGFINLSGLKYAALPENCISEYTAPEIEDAYSSVNETLDVYALGMILYRIFNGGTLPENKQAALEPPRYADQELSAIILKACSINPQERWSDPVQMGQMLVSYIQKNGAFDTPVVPPAPEPEIIPEPDDESEQPAAEAESITEDEIPTELTVDNIPDAPEYENDSVPEEAEPPQGSEIILESEIETEDSVTESNDDPEEISDTEQIEDLLPNILQDSSDEITVEEIESEPTITDDDEDSADEEIGFPDESEENTESDGPAVPAEIISDDYADKADSDDASVIPTEAITPEMTEAQLMQIMQQHDAFSDEAAEIKAAAVYLELDRVSEQVDDSSYDGVTDEVSQILSQADTLVASEVPSPAVAPEAAEITLDIVQESDITEESIEEAPAEELEYTEEETDMKSNEKPRRSHLVRNIILIVLLLLLLAGGALFYQFIVVQTVDQFDADVEKDQMIISISSEADESLLSISCVDKQGNQINQDGEITDQQDILIPVYQGKAYITGLRANTTYYLELHIAGLHILEGQTETNKKTPEETTLLQHTVITGNEPGSAILNFTIGGPDSERWNFTYSTPGYAEKTTSFSGTNVTLTDLIPNKIYTGVLTPEEDLFITKALDIEFTASELIQANDLEITGCSGGKLTVQWNAPENTVVESWTVRCYSNKEGSTYDETVTTSTTSHEFKGLNSVESFTVEVTAVGQAMHQEVTIPANSVTVSKLTADTSIDGAVNLSWESLSTPKNGWTVSYSISGSETVMTINCKDKNVEVKPVVPNTEYIFTVASADPVHTFCQDVSAITKATEDFSIDINNKKITAADLTVSLFKQPTAAQWDHTTLKNNDYTNQFSKGDKAGLLVYLKKEYEESAAELNATFVIYNDQGEIIIVSSKDSTWKDAWTQNNYILKIPTLPEDAGFYKVALYLNSQLVSEHDFSIS